MWRFIREKRVKRLKEREENALGRSSENLRRIVYVSLICCEYILQEFEEINSRFCPYCCKFKNTAR